MNKPPGKATHYKPAGSVSTACGRKGVSFHTNGRRGVDCLQCLRALMCVCDGCGLMFPVENSAEGPDGETLCGACAWVFAGAAEE